MIPKFTINEIMASHDGTTADMMVLQSGEDGSPDSILHVGLEKCGVDNLSQLSIGTDATEFVATHLPPTSIRKIGEMLIAWAKV